MSLEQFQSLLLKRSLKTPEMPLIFLSWFGLVFIQLSSSLGLFIDIPKTDLRFGSSFYITSFVLVLVSDFFAYFHVLAHKEGHDHRGFFLPPLQSLNFTYVQWFVAIFYGAIPNSYAVGHNKIHHRYSNGLDDVHTCYDLDRSDPWSFLLYLPRFAAYWTGFSVFWHFMSRKEFRFAGRMLAGMVYFYGLVIFVGFYAWDFALAFLLYPVLEAVVFFGAISYLWHSFLDGDNLDCEYVNSVTIIEGLDNIYNEDFHVVHHLPGSDQNIHWTEYPGHYERNIDDYKKYQATVFRDCEEGMMLYWIFSKKFDILAEHYVDLNGKMNHEEKKAHVLKRLRTIMPPPKPVDHKCKSA